MSTREKRSMSLTEHNNRNSAAIRVMIRAMGVSKVAEKFGVNHYYISKTLEDPSYIPSNPDIAQAMGYQVYRVSVPHGTKPKRYKRAIIYRTTSIDKIKDDLFEVTGVRWVPLEEEMEY